MSCTQNGFAIREGRHSFPIMPATTRCDSRRAIKSLLPLTREQIEKLGGKYPKPTQPKPAIPHRRFTDAERAEVIAQYNKGYGIPAKAIAITMGAHISSITYILSKAKVYIPTRTKGAKK